MTVLKWATPEAETNALTTDLNSLANAAYSAVSAAIDNETGLYEWIALELVLASLTPTAGGHVNVYLVLSLDGTNFADGGGSVAPDSGSWLCSFPLSTSTGAKRRVAGNLPIPPLQFKLVVENRSGVTLGASGNTLKYSRYTEQSV